VFVLAAGVAYTLLLQAPIRGEVFNVGDNALKLLMTRQFASGDFRPDLDLPAPAWVKALWKDGQYPYRAPYVYEVGERRFIRFPLAFPMLSAPGYALGGYRGLYLLPLLSTWAVWLAFLWAARRLRLDPVAEALGLAALMFASPLTYYSATFWEHPPAVALAFAGTLVIALTPRGHALAMAAGALMVGMSALLREELMVLAGLLGACAVAPASVRRRLCRGRLEPRGAVVAGLALPVAALFGFNQVVYGHPLGLHALNVMEALGGRPRAILSTAFAHWASLVNYAPPALFAILALMGRPRRLPARPAPFLVLLGLAVAVLTAVLVPVRGKDWGPRFLLTAVPLLCLGGAVALDRARRARPLFKHAALAAFAALAALGAYRNTFVGTRQLAGGYRQRLEVYREVASDPAAVVAVSHEFAAQQLAGVTRDKALVLAARGADLRRLARAAAAAGETRFLYVCDPYYPCGPLTEAVPSLTLYDGDGRPLLLLEMRGVFGRYRIYDARAPLPPAAAAAGAIS
jgi:hypothetical protein